MDLVSRPVAAGESSPRAGLWSEVGRFFSGAVLPMGSLSHYRNAARRSVGIAILFFFVFTVLISLLSTIGVGVAMASVVDEIHAAYQRGDVPDVAIRGGIAEVEGPQPFIAVDEQTGNGAIFIAMDTSGRIPSIDDSRYDQGFLLTRTELHVLNTGGRYQRLPLSQLNQIFNQDPLLIKEETVSTGWRTISLIVDVGAFIVLLLWNSVVRLMIIAVLALIFWGIGSLFRKSIGFGPFLITGLYAIVPAVYITYVFSRSSVSFPGLQTILLVLFWAVALFGVLSQDKFFEAPKKPRLWTALIGVPMLIWFIVDIFWGMGTPVTNTAAQGLPVREIVLWVMLLITGFLLAGLRLYFHWQDMQKVQPVAGPPAS